MCRSHTDVAKYQSNHFAPPLAEWVIIVVPQSRSIGVWVDESLEWLYRFKSVPFEFFRMVGRFQQRETFNNMIKSTAHNLWMTIFYYHFIALQTMKSFLFRTQMMSGDKHREMEIDDWLRLRRNSLILWPGVNYNYEIYLRYFHFVRVARKSCSSLKLDPVLVHGWRWVFKKIWRSDQ